ncbi:zinc ribbon domain-containing protein [Micromonospora sp. DT47]|uniref:zinc ribbon domain-containing protein n=1 Tax=Micromonospora sp. DT47 TaxID=3393431 RepID=UPI003CF552A3
MHLADTKARRRAVARRAPKPGQKGSRRWRQYRRRARITVRLVDERGTSSTCPACRRRVPKPRGRTLSCPHCTYCGHRDVVAAAIIATRTRGSGSTTQAAVVLPQVVTHRRAGRHLPGAGRSRRDPRRPTHHRRRKDQVGPRRPAPPSGESLAYGEDPQHPPQTR